MICTRLLTRRSCVTSQKNNLNSFRNFATHNKNLAPFRNFATHNKNLASFRNFATHNKNLASFRNFATHNKNLAPFRNFATHNKNLASFRNFATHNKNLASFRNFATHNKNLAPFRNFATRPRKDLKGNVLLYQMKWDKPWVFGVVGTGLIGLGIAGTVVVQQMIKENINSAISLHLKLIQQKAVHLGEDSLVWRLGFVAACTAALIAFNMTALRTAAKLQYNGTLNKLELTRVGAGGIRQTIPLTPKLGTVTFVESENKLVVKHPDTRFSHSLYLKFGDLHNEQLYGKLFATINER